MDQTKERADNGRGSAEPATPALDADGLPAFAADGTDLTVIRWMLAMSPEDRLRWLQTHMQNVAAIRRDQSRS